MVLFDFNGGRVDLLVGSGALGSGQAAVDDGRKLVRGLKAPISKFELRISRSEHFEKMSFKMCPGLFEQRVRVGEAGEERVGSPDRRVETFLHNRLSTTTISPPPPSRYHRLYDFNHIVSNLSDSTILSETIYVSIRQIVLHTAKSLCLTDSKSQYPMNDDLDGGGTNNDGGGDGNGGGGGDDDDEEEEDEEEEAAMMLLLVVTKNARFLEEIEFEGEDKVRDIVSLGLGLLALGKPSNKTERRLWPRKGYA
ncbi:hypothetical protein LguiA_012032 [Lonicera macranthoides]